MFHLWPIEVIIYGACFPNPQSLPEEIRLDLWPSFTSPRIKAAVCSYVSRPHESHFIDHLESFRHPLNTKCWWKATGCGEMSTSCRDWRWDHQRFTLMKLQWLLLINMEISILYNLKGLKQTVICSQTINTRMCLPKYWKHPVLLYFSVFSYALLHFFRLSLNDYI